MTTRVDEVVAIVRDTLALGPEAEVSGGKLLFYELSFTSLDLLDLLYRLEDTYSVAIPEGTLYRLARGDVDDDQFSTRGYLTPLGRTRLMELLFDTPPQVFPDQIHVQTLPRYCTVAAFARLVDHLVAERAPCSS